MLNQVKAYIMFIGLCMFCIGSLAIKTSDGFSANTQFTLSFQPRYFKINNVSDSSQIDIKVTIQDGGDYINGGDGLIKIYRIDNGIESYCDGWDITFTQDSGYVIGHKTANGNIPQSVAGTHYYRAKFCRRNDTDTDWEEIMSIPQAELYIVNGTISEPTGNNKYTFSTATTGELIIPCSGTIWPTNIGDTIATHARWRMFNGDGTSGTEFAPANTNRKWNGDLIGYGTGRTTNISITGMPANNSDFGRKTAEFYLLDPDNTSRRVFDIYEAPVKVYYPSYLYENNILTNIKNNPSQVLPNWYYYWSQTNADYGTHNYSETYNMGGFTYFNNGSWKAYIGPSGCLTSTAWNNASGIDYFANACRHEETHKVQLSNIWGNNNRNIVDDPDDDYLSTDSEATRGNYSPHQSDFYDPDLKATFTDHFNYGPGWRDCEDYCMHFEESWTNGDADNHDWGNPGKQY